MKNLISTLLLNLGCHKWSAAKDTVAKEAKRNAPSRATAFPTIPTV